MPKRSSSQVEKPGNGKQRKDEVVGLTKRTMAMIHKVSPSFKEIPLNPYMLEEDRFGKPRENPPKVDPRSLFLRYEPLCFDNCDYFGETKEV